MHWETTKRALDREREAFEQALAADRYDELTHRVFADWLEELGLDAEAEHHRLWSKEWQEAEDWLHDFASKGGEHCPNYDDYGKEKLQYEPVTYEMIMQAARHWIDTCEDEPSWSYDGVDYYQGDHWVQLGSESLRDMMDNVETCRKFWECYQIVTRTSVESHKQGNVFSCSC